MLAICCLSLFIVTCGAVVLALALGTTGRVARASAARAADLIVAAEDERVPAHA